MNRSKQKGTMGELKVAHELVKKSYYVFTELGDNAPIDLIAMHGDNVSKMVRLQVKTTTSKNGKITIYGDRNATEYTKRYDIEDFDYFVVYVEDRDTLLYVPINRVLKDGKCRLDVRFDKSKNNQTKNVNWYEEFLEMPPV